MFSTLGFEQPSSQKLIIMLANIVGLMRESTNSSDLVDFHLESYFGLQFHQTLNKKCEHRTTIIWYGWSFSFSTYGKRKESMTKLCLQQEVQSLLVLKDIRLVQWLGKDEGRGEGREVMDSNSPANISNKTNKTIICRLKKSLIVQMLRPTLFSFKKLGNFTCLP